MNIILLSGGSGKRLWPLSNDIRSKQFIKIFKDENGEYQSMVQRIYGQIKAVDPDATVTIATSRSQVSAIHNQLGDDVGISVEPCRRDTFAAIALATAYLHDVKGVSSDEAVVVCPVDPYVDSTYFECVNKLCERAEKGDKNLVLMGIQPTYPSEKYGYILPVQNADGTGYKFTEKPNKEKAEEFISQGALWNGGVFAYKLSYVLDKSKELLGTSVYSELFSGYDNLKKISFDYAVVEAESSIEVLNYDGEWKDLGTWNTLTEAMTENIVGDGVLNDTCDNVHVINELGIPVLGMGLKDVVISASPDGILVSDKEQSSYIKPYVDSFDQEIMFAEKSWGSYRVLDVEEGSMTVKVTLNPGHKMNYHSHDKRDEAWVVISGSGKTIVDGMEQPVKPGDVITMSAGCKHTVIASDAGLQIIEVQLGESISVQDKHKYEMPEL
ncbi:sugar phosphate nucleotidyltransferase [Butyrivibrio sp. XPD2006]|uniref:sugar phosphate nucleotidyltransferase n=1 Tax=Butyrivibrio sp. XPD2006 TaxID=1280668 RepID=UPI0003B6E7E9|nr:sugar phosphate nucleotidyltransferase [Butyrivibrio sp. XPD2006]